MKVLKLYLSKKFSSRMYIYQLNGRLLSISPHPPLALHNP